MNTFQLSSLPLPAELHLNGVCFKEEEETEEKAAMILPLGQLLMFLWKTNWQLSVIKHWLLIYSSGKNLLYRLALI